MLNHHKGTITNEVLGHTLRKGISILSISLTGRYTNPQGGNTQEIGRWVNQLNFQGIIINYFNTQVFSFGRT